MVSDMRILLTNDDGYDAPGLAALYRALGQLDNVQLDVIAPSHVQSGIGHTMSERIVCRRHQTESIAEVIVVEGTPVDCVRAAVSLPDSKKPDWVIAGINRGSNLGVDIYTSGTVAAAREAAILGMPAMAVSQLVKTELPDDWERSAREALAVISAIINPQDQPPLAVDQHIHKMAVAALGHITPQDKRPAFWNINLPRPPDNQPTEKLILAPVSTDPLPQDFAHTVDPDGTQCLNYVGRYTERVKTPGTDVAATFAGAITVTKVTL